MWKTINNGQSYKPIFDNENVISIGDIAVAPSDPNNVWIGMGEPNNSSTDPGISYGGDGVYKSTDGGMIWTNMGLEESFYTGQIVIHPQNQNIVYVAALGHFYTENQERGLYKTMDGGKIWLKFTRRLPAGAIGRIGITISPKNPEIFYAILSDGTHRRGRIDNTNIGKVFRTDNGGTLVRKERSLVVVLTMVKSESIRVMKTTSIF